MRQNLNFIYYSFQFVNILALQNHFKGQFEKSGGLQKNKEFFER